MTNYTIVSAYRNYNLVNELATKIKDKGFSCYNFTDKPADPDNSDAHPEDQMKVFESTEDFINNPYFKELFESDLKGLKNAENVILLLPAGTSAHIEIGIAYGLGKKCILIGEPAKPESLYLLFDEYYDSVDDFIQTI